MHTYVHTYSIAITASTTCFFLLLVAAFYSEGVRNNVVLNATTFHSVLPLDTTPGSYIMTLGFILLRTDITLYHHSFHQTDGFQHPIAILPDSGMATTQDYLVEGQYTLNFVLLVRPFDVISGSMTVDVINNLGMHVYVCMYIFMYVCMYIRTYACMHVYTYVLHVMYVMYVCMYVCI